MAKSHGDEMRSRLVAYVLNLFLIRPEEAEGVFPTQESEYFQFLKGGSQEKGKSFQRLTFLLVFYLS